MNLQFFFQIFGSKSGQVFQELDQIKNFQSLTTNILCGLLAMSYSSQFLKKKTLNIISDQNLDKILFRVCFLESFWSYIYKLQQILKSCGAKDFWIVLMILLTYQFIDEAQKGNSAFCLAKSFEGRNPKFFTRFIKYWWKLFKKIFLCCCELLDVFKLRYNIWKTLSIWKVITDFYGPD